MLTPDEQLLLVLGIGYICAMAYLLWRLSKTADELLRTVRSSVSPEFWESIGAPTSAESAAKDPSRAWRKFIRSGQYRRRCPMRVVEAIDAYRRQANWTLIGLTIMGSVIVYRFWPLLKPEFF
jgi:hypothetical protein